MEAALKFGSEAKLFLYRSHMTIAKEETPASVPTTPPSSWQEQGGYAACALAILGVGGVAGYHRQRRLEQEELENAARSKKRPRKVGGSGRRAPVPVPSAAAFSPSSHAARALAIGTALCGAGALLLAGAVAGAMGVSSLREFGDVMRDRIGPRVRAALGVRRDPTIEAEKAQLATLTPDQEEAHWRRVFERAAADDPKSKPPA